MYYYPFNIGDFRSHTTHLTLVEEAVYRRLLDHYYDTEMPIPAETQPVIRRLRLQDHSETVASILAEFFILTGDGWHNLRADEEIIEYRERGDRARENGKKGGRPKKNKGLANNPDKTQPVFSGFENETQKKAKQETVTNNQKPETKPKKEGGADAQILKALFDDFWQSWPSGFGDKGSRKNAEAAFLKLKPDKAFVNMMTKAVQRQHVDKQTRSATGQFCPNFKHVERWIKNREWENEIEHQRPVRQSRSDAIESALDEAFGRTTPGVLEGDFQRVDSHAPDDFTGRNDFEDLGGWPE